MDNKAMYKLSYGLFVLTVNNEDKQNGCIINTGFQVTSNPNRICIAVNKTNYTHELILKEKKFNISVINEEASFDLFKRFGFCSGREVDKFKDYNGYQKADNGIYYITDGTNAYISAKVEQVIDIDTHSLFIASVTDMNILNEVSSATYEFYQNNIKPAGNETNNTDKEKNIWKCKVCGYEYEGEDLPEDFICPWCKHPASDFEKVN